MGKKITFIVLILLGIFLRIWQLNTLPGGLFLDEINMAVDAKTLAQNGVDQYGRHFPFYFEDATDFKLPGYIYLATASYKIFGNTIFAMHFPSALAGIASIFLIGYLAFLLFPERKRIFYFVASTLALSPFAIHFSRISYETNVSLCFHLVYLISLLHVLKNMHPKRWLFLGSIAILLADFTYPSPRFVIPAFTTSLLFLLYILKVAEIKRANIFKSLFFLGIVVLTFIPTLIFPFADARQLNLLSVDSGSFFLKAQSVFISYLRLWNLEFLFDKGDLFAYRHGTKENGIFLLLFVVPYVLGIFWAIKNFSRKHFSLLFLFIFALIAGLPSALSSPTPYGTRVVVMLIPYTLFIALGIDVFFSWLGKQKDFLRKGATFCIGVVLAYQIGLFCYVYFVDFKSTSLAEFPTAPVRLAEYIVNFHKTSPTTAIYFLGDKSCHIWGNDTLYLWYYANLPNADMISWNNKYRAVRYATGSPFDAYDRVIIPAAYIPSWNLYLYSGYPAQSRAAKGSLLIRCGYTINSYNRNTEQLVKIFYADTQTQQEPYYVVTTKR